MASDDSGGRPLPTLVAVLLASFVLMIMSGIFFALGLPEEWARGLFFVTVVLWFVLGGALLVMSLVETRQFARMPTPTPAPSKKEDAEDED